MTSASRWLRDPPRIIRARAKRGLHGVFSGGHHSTSGSASQSQLGATSDTHHATQLFRLVIVLSGMPGDLSASVDGTTAEVTWTAPATTSVASYSITAGDLSSSANSPAPETGIGASATSASFASLTVADSSFTVTAVLSSGKRSAAAPSSGAAGDVEVAAGSRFTNVSVEICGDLSRVVAWDNPDTETLTPVSPAPDALGDGCVVVSLRSTGTTPTISQLTGSIFLASSSFPPPPTTIPSFRPHSLGPGALLAGGVVGTTSALAIAAPSGLPVALSVSPVPIPDVCALSGVTLSFTRIGSYVVEASQARASAFAPVSATDTIAVIAPQLLTFTSRPPVAARVGGHDRPVARARGSGAALAFSIDPTSTVGPAPPRRIVRVLGRSSLAISRTHSRVVAVALSALGRRVRDAQHAQLLRLVVAARVVAKATSEPLAFRVP